jgi:hypothetical protein
VAAKVCRETCVVGKSFARILVNEDWPRQWQRLDPVKGIVRKEKSAILPNLKVTQTMAAGTISGGNFGVSGMAITGRAHR